MKQIVILLYTAVLVSFQSFGQEKIDTKVELKRKTKIDFTGEWQYLTSDFYLFNENKFNDLINGLGKEPKTNFWGKLKGEKIEFLTLSATILNVEYYSNQDLTFPLFNFKVNYDKSSKYKTTESDNTEVIRLIDNLPLARSKEFIDATIEGEAITDSEGNKIVRLVADQLQNISKITSPSADVQEIIGELGNFLSASSRKKQYKFSSTIRLYDDTKFTKKVHSINVYSLRPSSKINDENFDKSELETFVDKIKFEDKTEINKSVLNDLIKYDTYPYFIVVNYKSKYTPPDVPSDKINSDYVRTYEERVEKDCAENINSNVVCTQERELIAFFKIFLDFKTSTDAYNLNIDNQITNDLSRNLYLIMKGYRKLLLTKTARDKEFKNVKSYTQDFSSRYDKVISLAQGILSENQELRDVKKFVDTDVALSKIKNLTTMNEAEIEAYLGVLYSLSLPIDEKDTEEYRSINNSIANLEKVQLEKIYEVIADSLEDLTPSSKNFLYYEQAISKINLTNCKTCQDKIKSSGKIFFDKYIKWELVQEKKKCEPLKKNAEDKHVKLLNYRVCIEGNIDSLKDANAITAGLQFDIEKMEKNIFPRFEVFDSLLRVDLNSMNKDELIKFQYLFEKSSAGNGENSGGYYSLINDLNDSCERIKQVCESCSMD